MNLNGYANELWFIFIALFDTESYTKLNFEVTDYSIQQSQQIIRDEEIWSRSTRR